MAIGQFNSTPLRKQVAFTRQLPKADIQAKLTERGYSSSKIDIAAMSVPGYLDVTDSSVITVSEDTPETVRKDLKLFAHALDYDCRIYILCPPRVKSTVLSLLAGLKLPLAQLSHEDERQLSSQWYDSNLPPYAPYVHTLYTPIDWDHLINLIAINPAGAPPNRNLEVNTLSTFEEQQRVLLQRAFNDCSSIHLSSKSNGMSGVDAFDVYAHHSSNTVGGEEPFRCFVKIGPRMKVAREYHKYCQVALENVPYHLGPRIRMSRCELGAALGLITSDYVSGAETLRDCIKDSRGVPAITTLFNQTLIAWRRNATKENRPLSEYLANYLAERKDIPPHRASLIQGLGSQHSLSDLKTLIANALPSTPVLVGVVHGDLHATNVLVRGNDAIIIDLERISSDMPSLIDAASLEAGLFVDGFVGDRRTPHDVLTSIRTYYTKDAFLQDDHFCHPVEPSHWFISSVRNIRMQARQMELRPQQYAWTLAAVFLKKSCNPEILDGPVTGPSTLTREMVRAMAYKLAEEIVLDLTSSAGITQ